MLRIDSVTKEAVLALFIGLVTNRVMNQRKLAIAPPPSISSAHSTPKLVEAAEAFTPDELSDLISVWQDDEPEGKFLEARHGITHYVIDRQKQSGSIDDSKSKKGIIVIGHGIGASLKSFKNFSDILVDKGFTVLRYDFFGHGYSKFTGENMWAKYDPDMFVDQLEDLLDFVSAEEKEDIVGYIGHSTGGVNGISANFRWSSNGSERNVFPKMVLVSPAIYAKKPLLARISDSIPSCMITLFKTFPSMKKLIGDNYLELITNTFGKEEETNEYRFPEKFTECYDTNLRLFGRVKGVNEHPFLAAAIVGISSYNIPCHLLPMHRQNFSKLLQMDGGKKSEHLFLWGDLDITVPFKENGDEIRKLAEVSDNLRFEVLSGIGHECFEEDIPAIAAHILPFLDSS